MQVGLPTAAPASTTPSAPGEPKRPGKNEPTEAVESTLAPDPQTTRQQSPTGKPLSEAEIQLIRQLSARDREVRAHEQAHLAAAGGYATGGPTFTYQTGPDGVRYAIGGEVGIGTSAIPGNPRATLAKAQAIMAAANAPAEPSGQDRAVAAAAAQMAARAQTEISQAAVAAAYTRNETGSQTSFELAF